MKKLITAFIALATLSLGQQAMADGFDKMQKTFIETPKDQPLATYWYWIDGNISEDGVIFYFQRCVVLFSNDCFNTVPQTEWLKTTEI